MFKFINLSYLFFILNLIISMPGANGLYSFYVFFFFGEYFYDSLLGPLKFFVYIFSQIYVCFPIYFIKFVCLLPARFA